MACADEVHRLQHGQDADCRLFQKFCDLGHYQTPGSTRQGIYAVTPSGILLASNNSQRPRRIAAMLESALEKWQGISRRERGLSDAQRGSLKTVWRWEDARPDDGLILEVTSRDMISERDSNLLGRRGRRRFDWAKEAWNRDWAWFSAEESETWLPVPIKLDASKTVPAALVERLVRFHLLDNVRGQTLAYGREHIGSAELRATVTASDSDHVQLALKGYTQAEVKDGSYPRGFAASLDGTATWDLKAKRFIQFEIHARSASWGRTQFNHRAWGPESRPVAVILRLAPKDAPSVAPAFIESYGWPRR